MADFGKHRFPKAYQDAVGMNASKTLHANSKELVEVLHNRGIVCENARIFEIGSAGGRNLKYIVDAYPQVKLFANDLFESESYANMDQSVKDRLTFFEGDTEAIVTKDDYFPLDLFISSDHLMHLQYEKADVIIKHVADKWKPKFILIRELKKEFETPNHPRLFHNYDYFNTNYEIMHEQDSAQTNKYFIRLLKLRP